MKRVLKNLLLCLVFIALLTTAGCVSCIPQYLAPPTGPASACYPVGNDPYIPMDHNPSPLNPWDAAKSLVAPFLYGPPR
ncbi:MAG TPA: hypothetical protein VK463_15010 [Desulfomonilaceae bacterium]|nr:hypothetical protein [Desulfomonilaceae bacterium]